MSKKKRGFEISLPEMDAVATPAREPDRKRGPMASAIAENAEALNERAAAEEAIRTENDALAHEYVKLKEAGLVQLMIPLDSVKTEALVRDRKNSGMDYELDELVASIRDVGLSNPIKVEQRADGMYELVQGFRRWSAYKKLRDAEGEFWDNIPAGLLPRGEDHAALYRRMIDENLVRKDLSFAEMAMAAQNYAKDPDTETNDLDGAVAALFKSTGYQKRTYIRSFAKLMDVFEKDLLYPEYISRNLGLQVLKRIEEDRDVVDLIRRELAAWGDNRGVSDELQVLRDAIKHGGAMEDIPAPKSEPAKSIAVDGAGGRRPRTTFEVGLGRNRVRCVAGVGQLTLKLDRDLTAVDRKRLEAGIAKFLAALD